MIFNVLRPVWFPSGSKEIEGRRVTVYDPKFRVVDQVHAPDELFAIQMAKVDGHIAPIVEPA